MVPLRIQPLAVSRQGVGVVTSWRAFLAMLKGMVVATVTGATVVVGPVVAEDSGPFDEQPEHEAYAALPPDWASSLEVSCSS